MPPAYTGAPSDPTAVMGRRTGAWIVDFVLWLVLGAFLGPTPLSPLAEYVDTNDFPSIDCADVERVNDLSSCVEIGDRLYFVEGGEAGIAFVVAWIIAPLAYAAVQGATGRSPGKALFGVKAVDEFGSHPGFGKSLVRTLLWVVDGIPCIIPLVGFITGLTSSGHRRVGDMAAKTFVVGKDHSGPVIVAGLATAATQGYPGVAYGAPGQQWGAPPPGAPGQPQPWGAPAPGAPGGPPSGGWDAQPSGGFPVPGAAPSGAPGAAAAPGGPGGPGAPPGAEPSDRPAPPTGWAPPGATPAPGAPEGPSAPPPTGPAGGPTPAPTTGAGAGLGSAPDRDTTGPGEGAAVPSAADEAGTTSEGDDRGGSDETAAPDRDATTSDTTTGPGTATAPGAAWTAGTTASSTTPPADVAPTADAGTEPGTGPSADTTTGPGVGPTTESTPGPSTESAAGAEPVSADTGPTPDTGASQAAPSSYNPQWDAARGTYIVWEPNRGKWLGWDESAQEWKPL